MILDGIQQVEIINQGIDLVNIIAMFVSVFCAALLAHLSAQKIYKNQYLNKKYEEFIDKILDNHNELFEIHKKIMSNPFIYSNEHPNNNQKIIEEIDYLIVDLSRQHTICKIKSKNIKKAKNIGLEIYFKNFDKMLISMMECINYTPVDYCDGKTSIVSFEERQELTNNAVEMSNTFTKLYEKLNEKI